MENEQPPIYKIWCEWDMGFADAYSSREKAEAALADADWDMVGMTLEEVKEENLVEIQEVTVS